MEVYGGSDQVDEMVRMAAEMKRNNQNLIKEKQKLQTQLHATEKQLLIAESELRILNKQVPFQLYQSTQSTVKSREDKTTSLPNIKTTRSSISIGESVLRDGPRPNSRLSDSRFNQRTIEMPNPYDGVPPMSRKRPVKKFKSLLPVEIRSQN